MTSQLWDRTEGWEVGRKEGREEGTEGWELGRKEGREEGKERAGSGIPMMVGSARNRKKLLQNIL